MQTTQLTLNLNLAEPPQPQLPDPRSLLDEADYILVCYSGGKDSNAALLNLIELGYKSKIEIHHQLVDQPGDFYFDWPITTSYCQAVAKHLNLPIYFAYREGGMRGATLRNNSPKGSVWYQDQNLCWQKALSNQKKLNTMMKFPMAIRNMRRRWCSSELKISVFNTSISQQSRFKHKKIVVITGERREEKGARQFYEPLIEHNLNCKSRQAYQYRSILDWSEKSVWAIIQRHGIVPHPAYYLNWDRCSCRSCIFLNNDGLARLNQVAPELISEISDYEFKFGKTIKYDKKRFKSGLPQLTYQDLAALGSAEALDPYWLRIANSTEWNIPIYVEPSNWQLPGGAYKKGSSGP